MNLQRWLFLPNERGKLPEVYGRDGGGNEQNGKSPPAVEIAEAETIDFEDFDPEPLAPEARFVVLENMRQMESVEWARGSYLPEDWAWFEEQLKNG